MHMFAVISCPLSGRIAIPIAPPPFQVVFFPFLLLSNYTPPQTCRHVVLVLSMRISNLYMHTAQQIPIQETHVHVAIVPIA